MSNSVNVDENVPVANLTIYQNSDFTLSVAWWADLALTIPINYVSVQSQIQDPYSNIILDLVVGGFTTLAANSCAISIPAATTRILTPTPGNQPNIWDFIGVSSTQQKKLLRGVVTIKAGVTGD
jgi:hypothetical protein